MTIKHGHLLFGKKKLSGHNRYQQTVIANLFDYYYCYHLYLQLVQRSKITNKKQLPS